MTTNIFSPDTTRELIVRINKLTPETRPQWGKMNASQMLAHLCVMYEMVYEDKHKRPNAFMRFLITLVAKDTVVGNKPYPRNARTAPAFVITDQRDFEREKGRLTDYIIRTEKNGEAFFEGRESHSFGKLTLPEWNNYFYKHLNHHLTQFAV
ncbi:DUF1569 domain-containing protein [Chryseolinea sp. T2]|uniref:DUF1569 domain-containing protein n=1 Tax=Chryseolinea sp. T2 TaxID=3129255 RepID=UPI003077218E